MKLRVKDIVKIWNNGAASLVAGQEGLMRRIEVFDMMEQPNIKPWLREHLLLITTGYVIRNDKEALLNLIRDMNEVTASALAIKTRFFDDFPKEALQLADELKLPLFFLDNNAGFVELVFPVMTAIVESRSNIELDTRYQIGKENKSELDNRLFFDLCGNSSGHPCGHPSLRSLAPPLRTRPAARGSRPVLGQLEAVSRSLSPPQIMLRRSSSPTSSIWCFLSWARLELKKVRPFLFSAIHLPAKVDHIV